MTSPLVRKLKRYVRFSHAETCELSNLTAGRVHRLPAGGDLLREGERPVGVHVLKTGWACRYKALSDGRRQIITFLFAGDLCDLHSGIAHKMDHSVGSLTEVNYVTYPRDVFEHLLVTHPRLRRALLWDRLTAEAAMRECITNLGQRSATERIAHLMCDIFLRQQAVSLANDNSCPLPITQSQLGEAVGLSLVHVNRTLQELRRMGLIDWRGSVLTIPDLDALKMVAMFDDGYLHLSRDDDDTARRLRPRAHHIDDVAHEPLPRVR